MILHQQKNEKKTQAILRPDDAKGSHFGGDATL